MPAAAGRQKKIEEAHQRLEREVETLASGETWQEWLDQTAKFHRYSLNNQLMIMSQRPDASMVAGVKRWNTMGRKVTKGEKGIAIFAPVKVRQRPELDAAEQDSPSDTADAEPRPKVLRGFRLTYVFDVSQTDGAPLAEPPHPVLLDGDVPEGLWEALASVAERDGWALSVEDIEPRGQSRPNGYTSHLEKRIVIGEHCPPQQRVKTLAHEIAHKELHESISPEDLHDGVHEVEAESVAYVVMRGAGIDAAAYSNAYVLRWSGGDMDLVKKTANNVRRVSGEVLDAVYEQVRELDPQASMLEATQRQQQRQAAAVSV